MASAILFVMLTTFLMPLVMAQPAWDVHAPA